MKDEAREKIARIIHRYSPTSASWEEDYERYRLSALFAADDILALIPSLPAMEVEEKCPECMGLSWTTANPCPTCHGAGTISRTLSVAEAGKDSDTILALAKMAGVKFDAHYNITTVDPPESDAWEEYR